MLRKYFQRVAATAGLLALTVVGAVLPAGATVTANESPAGAAACAEIGGTWEPGTGEWGSLWSCLSIPLYEGFGPEESRRALLPACDADGGTYMDGGNGGSQFSWTCGVTPDGSVAGWVRFTDGEGTADDRFELSSEIGVEYIVNGQRMEWGTYPGSGVVHVEVRALPGYELSSTAAVDYYHEFTDGPAAIEVLGGWVEFDDRSGTTEDTFTLQQVEGVQYLVNGVATPAGVHSGAGFVEVTSRPLPGYVVSQYLRRSHTFSALVEATPTSLSLYVYSEEGTTSANLTAFVHPSQASGTLRFLQDGVLIHSVTTEQGYWHVVEGLTPGESYTFVAEFEPFDLEEFGSSTSSSVQITIAPQLQQTYLSLQGVDIGPGSLTLQANLQPVSATGSVQFYRADNSPIGLPVPVVGGVAKRDVTGLSPNTRYSFSARFTPTDSRAFSTSSGAVSVTTSSRWSTSILLTAATVTSNSVELVASTSPSSVPGRVQFYRDGTALGSPVAVSNGSARYVVRNLSPQSTAGYSATFTPSDPLYSPSSAGSFSVTTRSACVTFLDVPSTRVFAREINWMGCTGISQGWPVSPGYANYGPDLPTKRDAMAAFIYRFAAMNRPSVREFVPPTTPTFVDVPRNHVFFKEIEWLASVRISTGWNNGDGTKRYEPNSPTLRDAMAAFLYRTAVYLGRADAIYFTPPSQPPFVDVRPDRVFYREIAWAYSTGVSTGWLTGCTYEYRPAQPILRDAMAAFMQRLDRGPVSVRTVSCSEIPPDQVPWIPPGGYPRSNPGNSKDCSDFLWWPEAQGWFLFYYPMYGDVARLDRDGDMIACESLPGSP